MLRLLALVVALLLLAVSCVGDIGAVAPMVDPDAAVVDVPAVDSGGPWRPQEQPDSGGTQPDSGPADSGTNDAGTPDAGTPDAGPTTDAGRQVPIFVAAGWGGRRVISCDLGRTWVADTQEATESADNWHQPFTPKALVYGSGTFVFLTGWGTDSVARVSRDGVDWQDVPLTTSYGGVGYSNGRFVAVGNRNIAESTDLGSTWRVMANTPASTMDREADAFDGVWAAGADDTAEFRRPGQPWQAFPGCTGARHGSIGIEGGFAAGGGVLISVGATGNTCALDIATGSALGASTFSGVPGPPVYAQGSFYVATGDRYYSSPDGQTWTPNVLPQGVRFQLIARAPTGAFVGVSNDRDEYFYSDNGTTWTAGAGPTGNGLLYVTFGYGAPSATCP